MDDAFSVTAEPGVGIDAWIEGIPEDRSCCEVKVVVKLGELEQGKPVAGRQAPGRRRIMGSDPIIVSTYGEPDDLPAAQRLGG